MMNLTIDVNEFDEMIRRAVEAAIRELDERRPKDAAGAILWTKRLAAQALNISEKTLDRWRTERGLPHIKIDNGKPMFRPEALRKWAADNEMLLKHGEG